MAEPVVETERPECGIFYVTPEDLAGGYAGHVAHLQLDIVVLQPKRTMEKLYTVAINKDMPLDSVLIDVDSTERDTLMNMLAGAHSMIKVMIPTIDMSRWGFLPLQDWLQQTRMATAVPEEILGMPAVVLGWNMQPIPFARLLGQTAPGTYDPYIQCLANVQSNCLLHAPDGAPGVAGGSGDPVGLSGLAAPASIHPPCSKEAPCTPPNNAQTATLKERKRPHSDASGGEGGHVKQQMHPFNQGLVMQTQQQSQAVTVVTLPFYSHAPAAPLFYCSNFAKMEQRMDIPKYYAILLQESPLLHEVLVDSSFAELSLDPHLDRRVFGCAEVPFAEVKLLLQMYRGNPAERDTAATSLAYIAREVEDRTIDARRAKYLCSEHVSPMSATTHATWLDVREAAMRLVLRHKFSAGWQRQEIACTHLGVPHTAYEFEERTRHDREWGSGSDRAGGGGLNLLGKALTKIRDEIILA